MYTIFICLLYGSLTVWITRFIFIFRGQLTTMVGMMAAMGLGMTIGLAIGTLLALWLPGQFFHSTLIGMIVGGAVGIIAGIPTGLISVMDGLLSGIMGGMMGTMLMVMMPAPYAGITVKLMSVLCSGIVFLLFIMLLGEVKPNVLREQSFVMSKPIAMFSVIIFALIFIQVSSFYDYSKFDRLFFPPSRSSEHFGHLHGPLPNHSGLRDNMDSELLVRATEFSFSPSSIHINAGQNIKFTLDNTGQMEHNFEILKTNVHIHAAPGKRKSVIVRFNKAGYYQVICTLPGHKEAGMIAFIHVSNL